MKGVRGQVFKDCAGKGIDAALFELLKWEQRAEGRGKDVDAGFKYVWTVSAGYYLAEEGQAECLASVGIQRLVWVGAFSVFQVRAHR
mmetsp:Transcript_9035/g.22859  ORF Transcript_9035/g.22859 Transcript_9035/m.22859 type:complete len:87 (-) Transcript_9035:618-878(-)|eukprot:1161018-Pelagomonas_calceolata.AAC.4